MSFNQLLRPQNNTDESYVKGFFIYYYIYQMSKYAKKWPQNSSGDRGHI